MNRTAVRRKVVRHVAPASCDVEVVGRREQGPKFRVPAFTSRQGVVKAADRQSRLGRHGHDDARHLTMSER